jgi:signal transduction histidine kinase
VRTVARYRSDDLVGYQGVVTDITASHDLESDRKEFLALLTRDLRLPLATLLGQGANLESNAPELPPDQVARIGHAIRIQAERVARLADDLADVSQLESTVDSARLAVNLRPVDLASVVMAALDSVRRPDEVKVRIPPGLEVLADARRLEQVVGNLVDNGLEHGAPPVVIEVAGADAEAGVARDAAVVEFTVTDQGPGVPADQVPLLFAGIRSLAHPDRDRSRGSGLGLFLARGLMEAMGGRIWYETGPGGGARFRVAVPVPQLRPPPRL